MSGSNARALAGLLLPCALLALAGCKDERAGEGGKAGGEQSKPGAFHQAPLQQLKAQGLRIGNFEQAAANPYQAKQCVRGKIEELDVLLCSYPDAAAAEGARAKLSSFPAGALTGAIRLRGQLALAVADRDKIDVKGERINRLIRAFAGKKQPAAEPKGSAG